jgi:alcohol dehydrogenase
MQGPLTAFDHHPRTRVVFGAGALGRLGELARELGAQHALVVTDSHIVDAGHAPAALASLEAAGLQATVFSGSKENPSEADAQVACDAFRDSGAELIVGLGGGSSLDTAKGAAFLAANGGRMRDYQGYGKARRPLPPLIAIPTTAGTGSECQSYALISHDETHQKMACGDPSAAPRIALLDPALTVTQPPFVTACTGLDAIAHAVETAVTRRRTPISWLYSREAFRLTNGAFEKVLKDPLDLQARAGMLLGAAYAGMAIENSMLGAAHSTANPLTARFGVVHGQAVGSMLPHVIRFNAALGEIAAIYDEVARSAGMDGWRDLAERTGALGEAAGFPMTLAGHNVAAENLPSLAEEAARQWTAAFNPREAGPEEMLALYRSAMG